MISYIVYAITSILIWNISVVIMDSLRIAFYVFNPSLIIIPAIVFIKFYNDFKNKIDNKKLTILYWTNYFILLLFTYLVYFFLYVQDFILIKQAYMCSVLFFFVFLVLQNLIALYVLKLEKKIVLYPIVIMILSILVSVIITAIKFQIFYGYYELIIFFDYKEMVKEGFFVTYVVIYQLALFYYLSKKGNTKHISHADFDI